MNSPEIARPARLHPNRTSPWEFRHRLAPCARALLALILAALALGAAAANAEPARAAATNCGPNRRHD